MFQCRDLKGCIPAMRRGLSIVAVGSSKACGGSNVGGGTRPNGRFTVNSCWHFAHQTALSSYHRLYGFVACMGRAVYAWFLLRSYARNVTPRCDPPPTKGSVSSDAGADMHDMISETRSAMQQRTFECARSVMCMLCVVM